MEVNYVCAGSGLWGKPRHTTSLENAGLVETVPLDFVGAGYERKVWCGDCTAYKAKLAADLEAQEARVQAQFCHPGRVVYRATFGAPGVGQSWECNECAKTWVRIGNSVIDPAEVPENEEPPWILTEADVR